MVWLLAHVRSAPLAALYWSDHWLILAEDTATAQRATQTSWDEGDSKAHEDWASDQAPQTSLVGEQLPLQIFLQILHALLILRN